MNILLRRPCPARDKAVDALFAENLSAHQRAGRAADDVTRASIRSRLTTEATRAKIIRQTDVERQTRPEPPTSHVRDLVNDVLSRPGLRGLPTDRDPS